MTDIQTPEAAEVWRPILGTQGLYEASSLGRIRSMHRAGLGRLMHPAAGPTGQKTFYMSIDGDRESISVGRAVALAFHGWPDAPSMEAQHINLDLTDDRAENIRWGYKNSNKRGGHQ